ncbi:MULTISPECIES: very short patch repair endonuclease [Acinetobacter]|uniref:very short patch repair endonuclease n=1 Tax=Acinetobacter TaxID=469 RepID=UPI00070DBAE7|nr:MULTISPECIES: DNA mismatch endonuclease Vsr [Acinetobacter]EHU2142882.1 DNA mismatch endonuclease Vsr [Acinetobacter baumannii]EHU2653934.1 DNA mismatch endonuclease Vsr [Acinetobacter baumannii]EHU2722084.1 DNA mismatch endonuclease Vsr [Acinetobacter baumannii]EHU2840465.1 DNA mismatch endonuclease Vsr [Acinetobacter baumannii]EHU3379760.1 DNA mismatch endonuclease Vsr [Acinetobacter baumannii]
MVDIVDSTTRSIMMSKIRSKNTKPELLIRSLLHRRGFRFRVHVKDLPGKPDIVLAKYKAVIFINGCFWHGHQGCSLFKLPGTRSDFWEQKIARNQINDNKAIVALLEKNWRIAIIWECSIRGKNRNPEQVITLIANWLQGSEVFLEVSSKIYE